MRHCRVEPLRVCRFSSASIVLVPNEFPNDENGDVLRRLQNDGDDLTQPRNIDFTVVFPTEDASQQFAEHFSQT